MGGGLARKPSAGSREPPVLAWPGRLVSTPRFRSQVAGGETVQAHSPSRNPPPFPGSSRETCWRGELAGPKARHRRSSRPTRLVRGEFLGFHPLIVGAECPACSVFSLRSRSLRIRSSRKSLTVSPAAAASSSIQVRNVSSSLKVSTTLDLVPFNSLAMLGFPSNPCSSSFLPGVRHGLPHRGSVNPFEGYAIGARPPDAGCPDWDA